MAEPIVYTFKADGAQQVASAIKQNNDALKAAERATREAARASEQLARANAELTKQRIEKEFQKQAQGAREVAKAEADAAKAVEALARANEKLARAQASNDPKEEAKAAREVARAQKETEKTAEALARANNRLANTKTSQEFRAQTVAARDLARAEKEAQRAAEQLFRTNAALSRQRLSEELKQQAQAARDLAEAQRLAGNGATALAASLSLASGAFIKGAIDARVEYEGLLAALNSATQGQGEQAFEFLNREVDRLRLNLPAATSAFTQLSAAAKGTQLEGQGVEEIFSAIAQAGRVNNLSLEKQEKAYLAITQVISKGVVQQEELRGQLSEALPGAVQIFARALNVSTAELGKLIQAGKVGLPELLKFAQQLESETAGSVEAATQTLGASFDQLSTEVNRFQVATGDALSPLAKGLADSASLILRSFNSLNPVFQKTVLLLGGLTAAFTLLIAAQIADNNLKVVATARETARAIALQASAIKTNALAASQALLAVATGNANAAQLAQVAALSKGAAQAGLFAIALGAIALNVASFQEITGAANETRDGIDEITDALNRLKESTAAATQGSIEGFANAEAAAAANRKAFEDNLSIAQKLIDKFIEFQNLNPFLRIATGFRELSTGAEAALTQQEAAFAELTDSIENNVLATFNQLKQAPNGLADATADELNAFSDSVEAAIATLEAQSPVLADDIKQKQTYLTTLEAVRAELDAVTASTGEGTAAIEDQAKALKEFREDAKRALQEQREEQNLQLDRQREDEDVAQSRARADELAAIERDNAEAIAQLERTNAEANAELERANAEEIAALQEQNAADIAEQQRVAQEQEGQLERRQQADLQRREDAFNRSQELAAEQFQDSLQADQEAFNQRQNEARQAFEEGQSGQQTAIDRQLQLEFATDDEERARLEAAFEREDAIAKRRAELEAPLLAAREAFEKQQQAEQVKFEDEQRIKEAVFNKGQQLAQTQFDTAQLTLKTAQEAQLQALRVANEAILSGLRQQQEVDLLAVKVAQEDQLKVIREQQERDLQAIRDEQRIAAQNEQRTFEDEQRAAQREFEDQQRLDEANFKATQRALDTANAQTIAGILGSINGAPERTVAGRRTGGPVDGSTPYMVGEAGPELFVPKQDGYVLNRSDTLRLASSWQPPSIRMPTPVSAPPQTIRGSDGALLKEVAGLRRDLKSFSRPEQVININESEDTMNRRVYQVIRAGLI